MLAHKATYEAKIAVEAIAGHKVATSRGRFRRRLHRSRVGLGA
jgi:pyruvate/2-oxoglutarate dehydrogenase complex dihydrolipoamide dehydrogenase (E3) component